MTSRQRLLAIAFLQFASFFFTWFGSLYAGYQFELLVLSTIGPDTRPSLLAYFLDSVANITGAQFRVGLVLYMLFYMPPTLAAYKMADWVKFQNISLVIALTLAVFSFLQMLTWEVGSQNGCTGCMGPVYLQLLFSFFVFFAATYKSVFHADFKKE